MLQNKFTPSTTLQGHNFIIGGLVLPQGDCDSFTDMYMPESCTVAQLHYYFFPLLPVLSLINEKVEQTNFLLCNY